MQPLLCNRQPVCSPGMSSVNLCPVPCLLLTGKGSLSDPHLQVKTDKKKGKCPVYPGESAWG